MLLESGDDVDQRDQVLVFPRIYKSNAYCKWSIKHSRTFFESDAYSRAALISTTGKTLRGIEQLFHEGALDMRW